MENKNLNNQNLKFVIRSNPSSLRLVIYLPIKKSKEQTHLKNKKLLNNLSLTELVSQLKKFLRKFAKKRKNHISQQLD